MLNICDRTSVNAGRHVFPVGEMRSARTLAPAFLRVKAVRVRATLTIWLLAVVNALPNVHMGYLMIPIVLEDFDD